MTEYEIRDSLSSAYGQISIDTSMCFTLVSAYLVVSYLAGRKLDRLKVLLVSALFGVLASFNIWGVRAPLFRAAEIIDSGRHLQIDGFSSERLAFFANAYPLVLAVSVLAAFYFMWHVRRAETE